MLSSCTKHSQSLLKGSEADVSLYDNDEARNANARLKNNKTPVVDALLVILFKYSGNKMTRCTHRLCKIWSDKRMPDDWNLKSYSSRKSRVFILEELDFYTVSEFDYPNNSQKQ